MDNIEWKNILIIHYKKIRNQLLLETDKYLLPDFPITPEQLEIVKEYRQALRYFTNNNYILPDKPYLLLLWIKYTTQSYIFYYKQMIIIIYQ
jgi:hypothetical protein